MILTELWVCRIGVLIGDKWACFAWNKDWLVKGLTTGKHNIAWAETVTIRLGLLVLAKLMPVRGRTFRVDTDNTTTQAALRKRKSKDERVNEEMKQIQRLLTILGCNVKEKRVTSKNNLADGLSRGVLDDRVWFNEVLIEIPADLKELLHQVSLPLQIVDQDL